MRQHSYGEHKTFIHRSIAITASKLDGDKKLVWKRQVSPHRSWLCNNQLFIAGANRRSSSRQSVDTNESDLLLNQRMGYVAISRAREEALIFTNSTERLRDALDRSVDREMAVEAIRQSRERNYLPREETELFLSSTNESIANQSFERDNSREEGTENEQTGEEIDLDLGS